MLNLLCIVKWHLLSPCSKAMSKRSVENLWALENNVRKHMDFSQSLVLFFTTNSVDFEYWELYVMRLPWFPFPLIVCCRFVLKTNRKKAVVISKTRSKSKANTMAKKGSQSQIQNPSTKFVMPNMVPDDGFIHSHSSGVSEKRNCEV